MKLLQKFGSTLFWNT